MAEGSAPVRGGYLEEASLVSPNISAEQRALFRSGITTEAHVMTRSGLAFDLLKLYFEREFSFDG